eukprot:851153_1
MYLEVLFLTNVISDGMCSWTFRIINIPNELNFGVRKIRSHADDASILKANVRFFGEKDNGYAWEASNCCSPKSDHGNLMNPKSNGFSKMKQYGPRCKDGDIVRMKLDLYERTLRFTVNGTECGIAFAEIENTSYRAAIFMYAYGGDTVGCLELIY